LSIKRVKSEKYRQSVGVIMKRYRVRREHSCLNSGRVKTEGLKGGGTRKNAFSDGGKWQVSLSH